MESYTKEKIEDAVAVTGIIMAVMVVVLALSLCIIIPICAKQARMYNEITDANITTSQVFWLGDSFVIDPNTARDYTVKE